MDIIVSRNDQRSISDDLTDRFQQSIRQFYYGTKMTTTTEPPSQNQIQRQTRQQKRQRSQSKSNRNTNSNLTKWEEKLILDWVFVLNKIL